MSVLVVQAELTKVQAAMARIPDSELILPPLAEAGEAHTEAVAVHLVAAEGLVVEALRVVALVVGLPLMDKAMLAAAARTRGSKEEVIDCWSRCLFVSKRGLLNLNIA